MIGVAETISLTSSEYEARGEMAQELVDPHASSVELEEEFAEEDGEQRDNEVETHMTRMMTLRGPRTLNPNPSHR